MPPDASQIETLLRGIQSLPTLSPVATRLLHIAGMEDADLDALVEIIESDPALSARLLGLCRRADKGLGDRITTVRRAVVMLGLDAVQAAALRSLSTTSWERWARSAPRHSTAPSPGPSGFPHPTSATPSTAPASGATASPSPPPATA
jgi:hypothetical protein